MQAPLKDLSAKRTAALDRLKALETGEATSTQLTLANQALVVARAAVDAEAKDIRCGKECKRKQELADRAEEAVKAAIPSAVAGHAKAIEAAKADVAANPLPASATPLADRLGVAPWIVDLAMSGLLSIGANGLAGVLIALGSSVPALHVAAPVAVRPVPFPAFDPVPPSGKRGRKRDPNVVDFVQRFREVHDRNPNIPEMRLRFPALDKATLWRNATAA